MQVANLSSAPRLGVSVLLALLLAEVDLERGVSDLDSMLLPLDDWECEGVAMDHGTDPCPLGVGSTATTATISSPKQEL